MFITKVLSQVAFKPTTLNPVESDTDISLTAILHVQSFKHMYLLLPVYISNTFSFHNNFKHK